MKVVKKNKKGKYVVAKKAEAKPAKAPVKAAPKKKPNTNGIVEPDAPLTPPVYKQNVDVPQAPNYPASTQPIAVGHKRPNPFSAKAAQAQND